MYRKKRSQVTIFIVGGIVILLVAAIAFYVTFMRNKGIVEPGVEESLQRGLLPPLQVYIQECTSKVSPPIIKEIALHGGTLHPTDNIYYNGIQVNYLCYTEGGDISYSCVNSLLLRQNMEDELGREISKKVKECVDLSLFEKQGYKVDEGEIKTKVTISKDSVFAEVDYPINLTKDSQVTKTPIISSEIKSPLGRAYELAVDIINSEISEGSFDQDDWMIKNNAEFLIEKDKPYPDTVYALAPRGLIKIGKISGEGDTGESKTKLMGTNAEYDFAFQFAIQDHASVAQKRPDKKSAYGCCINKHDNVCFKNVPEVLCEINGGIIDTNAECSCDAAFRPSGTGVSNPSDCENTYDPTTNNFTGRERKHGESWCVYDSIAGRGFDFVGTRHYKHTCINGMQFVEECRDYREELCTEQVGDDGRTKAACRKNRWQDCSQCLTQQCCENIRYRDCFWNEGFSSKQKCVPQVPPGLRFWESEGADVCFAANTDIDCEGLSCPNVWIDESAIYCYAQGDCGNYRNFAGVLTKDGFFETDMFDSVRDYVYLSEDYSKNPNPAGKTWTLNLPLNTTEQPDIVRTAFENPLGNIPTMLGTAFNFVDQLVNLDIADFLNPFSPPPGTHIVDFAICNLWKPPMKIKGEDVCKMCSNDITKPCTEYKCKSIASVCQFEMDKGVGSCKMPEKDSIPPKIEFINESLKQGYKASKKMVVIHQGVEITPAIKPHKPFTFSIRTSEPTICKINYAPEIDYYALPSLWFGDATYSTRHNITLRMPPRLSVPQKVLDFLNFTDSSEFYSFIENTVEMYNYYMDKLSSEMDLYKQVSGKDIKAEVDKYAKIFIKALSTVTPYLKGLIRELLDQFNRGGYYLFVECVDTAGNPNEEEFFIGFIIDDNSQDNEPPSIVLEKPENNGRVPQSRESSELKIYLDEPAECKYSSTDRDFSFMENYFVCTTSLYQLSSVGGGTYECKTELQLPGLQNKIFIRCKDNPPKTEEYSITLRSSDRFFIEGMPEPTGSGISPYLYTNITLPNTIDASSSMIEGVVFDVNSSTVNLNLYIEDKLECKYSNDSKPFDAMESSFGDCIFSDQLEKGLYKCPAQINVLLLQRNPAGKSAVNVIKTSPPGENPNDPIKTRVDGNIITINSLELFQDISLNLSDVTFALNLSGNLTCMYNPNPVGGTPAYDMQCSSANNLTECSVDAALADGDNPFTFECYENGGPGENKIHVKCMSPNITARNVNTQSFIYTLSKGGELRILDISPHGTISGNSFDLSAKVSGDIIRDKIKCGYRENLYDALVEMGQLSTDTFSTRISGAQRGFKEYFITCRDDFGNDVTESLKVEVS